MQKLAFIFLLTISATALAGFEPRCGTDAFGNEVCLDSGGRLSRVAGAAREKAASGVAATAAEAGSEEPAKRRRCGVDPFGNRVCSQ